MDYYELVPPQQWQAGTIGDEPICYDCADCGAKEPEIAGFLAASPNYTDIGVITKDGYPRLAMFCADCFTKRTA